MKDTPDPEKPTQNKPETGEPKPEFLDYRLPFDWSTIPDAFKGKGAKKDLNKYEDLDEGRIPVPIPHRVQSGGAYTSRLILDTYNKVHNIQWEDVEFIALGCILSDLKMAEAPKSRMRMVIREFLLGDPESKMKIKSISVSHLLDIYIKGHESPFRIDQGKTNYRGFLMSPGYVSIINFRRTVEKILFFSKNAKINENLRVFIETPREKLLPCWNVFDFQLESQAQRMDLADQPSVQSLDLKRPEEIPAEENEEEKSEE